MLKIGNAIYKQEPIVQYVLQGFFSSLNINMILIGWAKYFFLCKINISSGRPNPAQNLLCRITWLAPKAVRIKNKLIHTQNCQNNVKAQIKDTVS